MTIACSQGGVTSHHEHRGCGVRLSAEEVLARWPAVKPLVAMTDPEWRFVPMDSGVLSGTRAHATYVEALWVIDEERAGMTCLPIAGYPGPVVVSANFSGPLREVVEILGLPVRFEEDG